MANRAIYRIWVAHLLVCTLFHARAIIQFCAQPSEIMGTGHDVIPDHLSLSTRIDLSQLFLSSLQSVNAPSRADCRQYSLFQSDAQYFSQLGRGHFYPNRRGTFHTDLFTQSFFTHSDGRTCDLWQLDFYCGCRYFLF